MEADRWQAGQLPEIGASAELIRRLHNAISFASNGSSVRMWFATCRPTIIREYTSRTNATYAQPDQVRTYVMSATHS